MNPFRFIETEYAMYKNAAKVRKQYNLQNFFVLFLNLNIVQKQIYCPTANAIQQQS